MVAPGGGDDTHFGGLTRQEVRECATRFERAGVLQLLEFQRQRERRQPETGVRRMWAAMTG
jgi:hypothetical protein